MGIAWAGGLSHGDLHRRDMGGYRTRGAAACPRHATVEAARGFWVSMEDDDASLTIALADDLGAGLQASAARMLVQLAQLLRRERAAGAAVARLAGTADDRYVGAVDLAALHIHRYRLSCRGTIAACSPVYENRDGDNATLSPASPRPIPGPLLIIVKSDCRRPT